MLYHLSCVNLNNKTLKPRIPDNFFTKNKYENDTSPRVCFATDIDGALMGLDRRTKGEKLFVHTPMDKVKFKNPSTKEVPDCKITKEVWVEEDVKVKCIGQILVVDDANEDGLKFKYGNNTAELYKWKWKWVSRQNLSETTHYIKEEIDMASYSKEFAYCNFLLEDVKRQADLERYINECILMNDSENTVENITALNEGFMDTLKNVVSKLTGVLTTMWNKFIEATNNLLKTDKGYLERYKDIILKKKPLQYKVQMYDYPKGIPEILRVSAPYFNFNEMIKDKKALDKDTFVKNYFNSFAGNQNNDVNFEDIAKSKFRGGDKQLEIPSDQLNFTDMYNYCYTYDNLRKKIEKDKATIINAGNTAVNAVNSMVNSGEIKEGNTPPAENNQNNGNNQQPKQESFIFTMNKKKLYYSHIHEAFILEADDEDNNSVRAADKSTDAGNNMKKSQNPSSAYRIVDPSDEEKNKATVDKAEGINGAGLTSKEVTDMIKVYMDICGALFAAKLTASENAYRTYMKIIKAHVKDYVKVTDNAKDNQAAQTGTIYNNGNDNNNENK